MVRTQGILSLALTLFVLLSGTNNVEAHEGGLRQQEDSDRKLISARIIGGTIVSKKDQYPWMTSLQYKRKTWGNGWRHFCGGTLINKRWILTAAHCVKYIGPDRVQIGTNSLTSASAGVIRKVTSIIRNPNYATEQNDLALLRLNKDVNNVDSVILNRYPYTDPYETVGSYATVIGWGYTSVGSGLVVDDLRQVDVPIQSTAKCQAAYGTKVTVNHICAGYDDTYKMDSCSGDSGGPLLMEDSTGQISQIGVVSYGKGCANYGYYGVYQRNSEYFDWIKSVVESDGDLADQTVVTVTSSPTAAPTKSIVREALLDIATTGKECKNEDKKSFKEISDSTSETCVWNCITTSSCYTATLDISAGICRLFKKNKCATTSGDSDDEVYVRETVVDSLAESGQSCNDQHFASFKTTNAVKCAYKCSTKDKCNYAVLNLAEDRCYLHETCADPQEDSTSQLWAMSEFGKGS